MQLTVVEPFPRDAWEGRGDAVPGPRPAWLGCLAAAASGSRSEAPAAPKVEAAVARVPLPRLGCPWLQREAQEQKFMVNLGQSCGVFLA